MLLHSLEETLTSSPDSTELNERLNMFVGVYLRFTALYIRMVALMVKLQVAEKTEVNIGMCSAPKTKVGPCAIATLPPALVN